MSNIFGFLSDDEYKKLMEELQSYQNSWINLRWTHPEKLYIASEQDEQGTFYGYKVLVFDGYDWYSYARVAKWQHNYLKADRVPDEHNTNGIYFMKRFEDDEIREYYRRASCNSYPITRRGNPYVVRCACSGTIVEGETGFRSQEAQITHIYTDEYCFIPFDSFMEKYYGNRQNRENRERTNPYSDREEVQWQVQAQYYKSYNQPWNTLPNVADEDSTEGGE